MAHRNPLAAPDARSRGRKWGERVVVLLLFLAVPAVMVGYVLYRQEAERQDEQQDDRLADWSAAGTQPYAPPPPPKWVPREPPPLEVVVSPPGGDDERIAYVRSTGDGGGVRVVTPAGEYVAGIDGFDDDYSASTVRLSRDRTRLAVTVHDRPKEADAVARGVEPAGGSPAGALGEVLVYQLDKPGPPVARLTSDHRFALTVWGTDADTLFVEHAVWDAAAWTQTTKQMRYDLTTGTGTATPIPLPDRHTVTDVSPDGKTLLVNHTFALRGRWRSEGYLATADTLRLTRLSTGGTRLLRFSPDGKRVVGVAAPDQWRGRPSQLVIVTLADEHEAAVPLGDDTLDRPHAVWSPDGSRLAVFRRVLLPGVVRLEPAVTGMTGEVAATRNELTLRDTDGSNPTPFPAGDGVFWFDWR